MGLTKYEKETVILFNDAEETAEIYTCNNALIRKLDVFCSKTRQISRIKEDEYSKTYTLPKKFVTIRFPKEMSEEKRKELSARAKARYESSAVKFNKQQEVLQCN